MKSMHIHQTHRLYSVSIFLYFVQTTRSKAVLVTRNVSQRTGLQTFMPRRFLEGVIPSALLDTYDFWGSHSARGVRNDKGVVTGPTEMLIGYQKRPPSRSEESTRQGTLLVVRLGGEHAVIER